MNACENEDDCPTPTRCRHLDRCPKGASEGSIPESRSPSKVVDAGATGSALTEYQPEMWTVQKDDIYMAIDALEAGLEHARENLTRHDADLGRTTRKNEMWAKTLERDIDLMIRMIDRLRKYSAATMPPPNVNDVPWRGAAPTLALASG